MPSLDIRVQKEKKGTTLALRVIPRASKNEIVEVLSDGTLKVRLTAPPVDGRANEALLKFLAEILNVPVTHLEIIKGTTGRIKLVSVTGMDQAVLHKKIMEHIR
jgi:uncharacterized protein (TIGR00251 family)